MRIQVSILTTAIVVLTACGPMELDSEIQTQKPPTDSELDITVEAAQQTYTESCIQCHGGDLNGLSGPSLVENSLTPEEIQDIIENGQGAMPPIDLSDSDRENLANWLTFIK